MTSFDSRYDLTSLDLNVRSELLLRSILIEVSSVCTKTVQSARANNDLSPYTITMSIYFSHRKLDSNYLFLYMMTIIKIAILEIFC